MMVVYVDDAMIRYRGMRMNHLIADSTEELLAMVETIGVQAKWIQKAGTPDEHFDIAASKRDLAIEAGAVAVSSRDIALRLMQRRYAAKGKPIPTDLT